MPTTLTSTCNPQHEQLDQQCIHQQIAAALSIHEWLIDRQRLSLRLISRCPGASRVASIVWCLLAPRLLATALKRAHRWLDPDLDAPALVRRLLKQGNAPHHLLHLCGSAVTAQRVANEQSALALLEALLPHHRSPDNPDPANSELFANAVEHELSAAAQVWFAPLRSDFKSHLQRRLGPWLQHAQNPDARLHVAREAWELNACMGRLCERLLRSF